SRAGGPMIPGRSWESLSVGSMSWFLEDAERVSALSAAPCHAEGAELTPRRGAMGSHGDAESAEVLRAQRVGSGPLALRRLRCVVGGPDLWWFAPGESGFAGWNVPRPAGCLAG